MSECCIDYMDMDRLDDEEKRELYRKERLFRSYEKGTVHRKLERMHSRAFCRNLERHIRSCTPSNEKERILLGLVNEGMSLISKDSPHIMSYDYDFQAKGKGTSIRHRLNTRFCLHIPLRIRLQTTWKVVFLQIARRHTTRLRYHLPSSHPKQIICSDPTTIRNGFPDGLRSL